MCMGCQKSYCQKYSEEWSKNDERCPTRCKNLTYQKSIEKNNMLSRLKFKCGKCGEKVDYDSGEKVDYDSVEKHMEVCDQDNMNNVIKKKKRALTYKKL